MKFNKRYLPYGLYYAFDQAFKFRHPSGNTMTKTNTENDGGAEEGQKGIGYTSRSVTLFRKPKRFFTKQKTKLSEIYSNVLDANAGARVFTDVAFVGTTWQAMCQQSSRIRDDTRQGVKPYFLLTPNADNTGGPLIGTQYNQSELCVDSSFMKLTLKNFTNAPLVGNVTLWLSKNLNNRNVQECYGRLADNSDGGLPTMTQPAAGSSSAGVYGRLEPGRISGGHSIKGMGQFWKAIKNVKVTLAAAATEIFVFKVNHNMVIDLKYLLQNNNAMPIEIPDDGGWLAGTVTNFYPPGCLCLTVDFIGTPVQDKTGPNLTSTLVTTGNVEVAYIVEKTTTLSWSVEKNQSDDVNIGYNELPENVGLANQEQMNENDATGEVAKVVG